jgi:hypothetical protein
MQPGSPQKMSNPRATAAKNAPQAKPRQNIQWLIVVGVSLCTAIALVVVGRGLLTGPEQPNPSSENRPKDSPPKRREPAVGVSPKSHLKVKSHPTNEKKESLVDDDGKTLWVSPTDGRPLDLGYLSPGAQIIAVLRPMALLKHPEGEKVRTALGPEGQRGMDYVEQVTGVHLIDMEQLIVGGQAMSDGKWMVTFVVHATTAIPRDALIGKLPGAAEKNHDGKSYWLANERAYYLPTAGNEKVLVIAPADAIADIIDLAGNPPPLRRDIERLIDHTDADRHATIIVAPNSLFSEGQSIFAGELAGLRGPLFWFLGDELSGAALSINWGDNFFLELIATPKLETSPERAARIFVERCAKVPEMLEKYDANLKLQPYAGKVVSRFPAMVKKLAAYTRSGFEPDHLVLRCYLPVVAGHNLLMGAELTLAESAAGATRVATDNPSTSSGSTKTAAILHDRISKKTSLRFAKDTLEAALDQLSQDIGVPIVIRGPDLQADGITKNQSFGIDLSNKPAEEILVQILRLANPDKSATGPSDQRQKLVFIIEQKPDKTEQIVITTRAKAAERHNELPAAFRAAKP